MIVFIIYHMCVFMNPQGEVFRLHAFGGMELAGHILLLVSLMVHLAVNIRPLCMALGIADRKYVKDIILILSIILLVTFMIAHYRGKIDAVKAELAAKS